MPSPGTGPDAELVWTVAVGALVVLTAAVLLFAAWYERRPLE